MSGKGAAALNQSSSLIATTSPPQHCCLPFVQCNVMHPILPFRTLNFALEPTKPAIHKLMLLLLRA
jgi:hypothetical protein